jgi:hypothetical protein
MGDRVHLHAPAQAAQAVPAIASEYRMALPSGFENRIRGVLHFRTEISRLAQAEADRALEAAELPEPDRAPEQRTALARQAAGRA